MNKPSELSVGKEEDSVVRCLSEYAHGLLYEKLSPQAIHACKIRVIDTLGALIGGFFGEPCRISRELAARMPDSGGATIIGTRIKTTLDMAAFVNGNTARYAELNDTYHNPGSYPGHPSDVMAPTLAVAEYVHANGRDFITAVVLAYEVFLRISDVVHNRDFDHTTFACIANAIAAGKLLRLSRDQLAHCISMAVVPNCILRQVRRDHLTMYKTAATGHAGRAGVFAALLARTGMEGPHLPFEGKAGWCDHVAGERFSLNAWGSNSTPFKILDTLIKTRPSCGTTTSSVMAAEQVSPFRNVKEIKHVTVEVYKNAKVNVGSGEQHWNPQSRETADHSIPYVIAATLMDGTVTLSSFNDSRLWNPELRALMQKIDVVENEEFTKAYEREPQEHRTRITVVTDSGEIAVGETGGDQGDVLEDKTDAQIEEKFRGLTEDLLGARQVNAILDRLWHLEEMDDVADLAPTFVLD